MSAGYAESVRNARLDAVRAAIDAGSGAGKIEIYSGSRPATGAALAGNTLLCAGTFSEPCASASASGVLTFDTITYAAVAATGTATWARVKDSGDTFVLDWDVGVAGSGADVILNSVSLVEDGLVTHVSASITGGNA